MSAVKLTKKTLELVDALLPEWQEMTKSEDTSALIARSVINALLDLRSFASEFDEMDIATRKTAA